MITETIPAFLHLKLQRPQARPKDHIRATATKPATAASTASMNSSVCMIAVIASGSLRNQGDEIALAAMFTIKASSAALNRNARIPWAATVRRIGFEATATSDTCEVMATTKEK